MSSRLDSVTDWTTLARECSYQTPQMARRLGISVRSLQRYFLNAYRSSPQAWVETLRLRDAILLVRTGESIKVIADKLGFKQASHFSRKFKATFGVSPRAFASSKTQ
jgi:transcriptional regulator GlxA family with amidase domain